MSLKQIWVFRHGETDWNVEERFQGHLDIPLNARGRKQADELVPRLKEFGLEAILSSDLSRAEETARIVAAQLGIPVFQDVRLREANLGAAQGLTRPEIEAKFGPELARRWKSSHVSDADISYPGGETGVQIMDRVSQALEEFLQNQTFDSIGVATHGGVIRRIMQMILPPGSPPVAIPNAVVYPIVYDLSTRKLTSTQ